MKFGTSALWALLAVSRPLGGSSMFAEDAGSVDFLVATAGHPVTRFAYASQTEESVITSDASPGISSTSCYVASRSAKDGSLLWRRNVCTKAGSDQTHAVTATDDFVFTIDNSGVMKAWATAGGHLLWDLNTNASSSPAIWHFSDAQGVTHVAAAAGEELFIANAVTGALVGTMQASVALEHCSQSVSGSNTGQWLGILPSPTRIGSVQSLLGSVAEDGTVAKKLLMLELDLTENKITLGQSKALGHIKSQIMAQSIQTMKGKEDWLGYAQTKGGDGAVEFSIDSSEIFQNVPVSVANGLTRAVHRVDAQKATTLSAGLHCQPVGITAGIHSGAFKVWGPEGKLLVPMGKKIDISSDDIFESTALLSCTEDEMTMLFAATSGATMAIKLEKDAYSAKITTVWKAEEGLSKISAAIMLDGSHIGVDDLVGEQAELLNRLSFSSRLSSQAASLTSVLSGALSKANRKDHVFGFVKVAALLSQVSHRMWGMDTAGGNRGQVRWTLDLPRSASWHTMVHGTKNSQMGVHGINGGTHSREILVLSASSEKLIWHCVDGTNGVIHGQGSFDISSPIKQVIPIYGAAESCRQGSILLHEDMSMSAVPNDEDVQAYITSELKNVGNGLFAHSVSRGRSALESFQVTKKDGSFTGLPVGHTVFSGEDIAAVSYPIRDEIVQRMSTVLGDNSLLLKYINPHMVAIITTSSDEGATHGDLAASIAKKSGSLKRKPAGVGNDADVESSSAAEVPNLFVNLMDTVTGRVLHRTGHVSADPSSPVSVAISENWVIYTFVNKKSRRTELGVLTLHEGMIDSKSLTAFSAPEQASSFSSFDVKESKPVVLTKLYTFPKAVTALGSTSTRDGISVRQILFATNDGRITAIPRHLLETRRPTGELKPAEKTEGLIQYNELIPMVPLMSLTYNRTVEGVNKIISTHTGLESQSLVLAFGGPDVFFTRTSPTKGFDLLPDSFSHVLVSIVTVGLLVILVVVRKMAAKKSLGQGWI